MTDLDLLPDLPRAACRHVDPEVFFARPCDEHRIAAAKAVCAGCPERDLCLAYALAHDDLYGVWAGTTRTERRQLGTRGCGSEASGLRPAARDHGEGTAA